MTAAHSGGDAPPHIALRTATAPCHERVDAAFGRYSLDDVGAYGRFLQAHARALPALEAVTAELPDSVTQPRLPLLLADLQDLGLSPLPTLALAADRSEAARWGIAYVLEGSRLGGAMLARSVAPGLPRRFLAAAHAAGEWRAFRAALDVAITPETLPAAIAAADAAFHLYERSAGADG